MHSKTDPVCSKTTTMETWSVESLEISEYELGHIGSDSPLKLAFFFWNSVDNQ